MRLFSAAFVALAIALAQVGLAAPLRPNSNGISANLWPGVDAVQHPAEAPPNRVFRRLDTEEDQQPHQDPLPAHAYEEDIAPLERKREEGIPYDPHQGDVKSRALRWFGGRRRPSGSTSQNSGGGSNSRTPPSSFSSSPSPERRPSGYNEHTNGPLGPDGVPVDFTGFFRPVRGSTLGYQRETRRPSRQTQRQAQWQAHRQSHYERIQQQWPSLPQPDRWRTPSPPPRSSSGSTPASAPPDHSPSRPAVASPPASPPASRPAVHRYPSPDRSRPEAISRLDSYDSYRYPDDMKEPDPR